MEGTTELEAVRSSRRRVEQRLDDLRAALHEDLGIVPRTAAWVLPAVGVAVGFALGYRALRRRRRAR